VTASRTAIRLTTVMLVVAAPAFAAPPNVRTLRVPNHGVQPQLALERDGATLHLIYLTGDAQASDIQYLRVPTAGMVSFADRAAVRVNAHPGSALAIGTIRGAHLSLGRNGVAHVAWMGSGKSEPRAPGRHAPMLYTRSRPDGTFEPERNLITKFVGLDGGGTVAADEQGNVYVAWHAPNTVKGDEASRRVFVARSTDDGATFGPEEPIVDEPLGACGCCGMELLAPPGGTVVGLFRTATRQIHRDTRAFLFQGSFDRHWAATLEPSETGTCQMSTYALAQGSARHQFVAAWETLGRIRFGAYSYRGVTTDGGHDVPGAERNSKHPALAIDKAGNVLVAWAVGTGWQKGGSVAWQVFDRELKPIPAARGTADGLPAWSRPAAFASPAGGFVVVY
jgi:hypothetical protein